MRSLYLHGLPLDTGRPVSRLLFSAFDKADGGCGLKSETAPGGRGLPSHLLFEVIK